MIIPLPFYEHYWVVQSINLDSANDRSIMYYLCDFIQVFMLLRLFFVARTFINYSVYTDAYSKKLCRSYGFTSGVRFTLKVQCVMNPAYFVGTLFLANILIFSYVLRVFEIPYQRRFGKNKYEFDDFNNSLWLILMTITTVGFGDIIVHTYPGRFITMIVALCGPVMISLVVLVSASIFELSSQ
jgi:hypothetical protein